MTMNIPSSEYWIQKTLAYLHDPFDKALKIKGHQERARQIMRIFGLQVPNEEDWKIADAIAAGFERGILPEYDKNEEKSGSVPFINHRNQAWITHPVGKQNPLGINLDGVNPDQVWNDLQNFLTDEIPRLETIAGDYEKAVKLKYFYTHLVLRFRLAEKNIGSLGGLWHRIPADTRFPDHSIWHHNALTSAIYSALQIGGGYQNLGLMVFSITPVQPFIAKARKVRDFWTGSVLLSWLAFEGIKYIMEHLGPDHVIYPSLIDQPLVNEYLKKEYGLEIPTLAPQKDIASFPNKFVCLIPLNKVKEIGDGIKNHIRKEWIHLVKNIADHFGNFIGNADREQVINRILKQAESFWELNWAAAKLLSIEDKEEYHKILPENIFKTNEQLYDLFHPLVKDKVKQYHKGIGIFYSASHALTQMTLAASKSVRSSDREPQNGIKCSMCHEFEVIHDIKHPEKLAAPEYEKKIQDFWNHFVNHWGKSDSTGKFDFDVDENSGQAKEKLCGICLTKRIGYASIRKMQTHVLQNIFRNVEKIPSTTELALFSFFNREKITDENKKREIAQSFHQNDALKNVRIRDRYYAILLMDGDWMGKLVNGETIEAKWKGIMHPEIVRKIMNHTFDKNFISVWDQIFRKPDLEKRLLTPAIHASISEALGDFSIYHVSRIVRKYSGRLIYAGGDDVCALLPLDTVLDAAREIRMFYHNAFCVLNENGENLETKEIYHPSGNEKLSVGLGGKSNITISAGILICHHKEDLKAMINEAHQLLDEVAKKKAGRDALAIELRKRSGGSRYFVRKWDDPAWEEFARLGKLIQNKEGKEIASGLAYKLQSYKVGLKSIAKSDDAQKENLFISFIQTLLEKSITSGDKVRQLAESIRKMIANEQIHPDSVAPEALIVASFLMKKEDNQ